jgi:LPXTG-motif cell wall-anchored protein
MVPSTGSTGWDAVLQIGIAAAMLVTLVLLVRDYRNRR